MVLTHKESTFEMKERLREEKRLLSATEIERRKGE